MSLPDAILMVATGDLHPDPNNAKTHTEANIEHIRASIEKFGFADPIGAVEHPDPEVGGYMVVEGHGRLEAAVILKLDEVPVLVLSLEEATRRGYGIAHNQIQLLTGMDMSAVAGEFGRLGVGDDDFNSLGFSDEDVLFMPQIDHTLGDGSGTMGTGTGGTGDQFSAPDGGEYDETPEKLSKSGGGFIPAVHRTTLRFTSELSYNRFLHMMQLARTKHPLAASMSERMLCVLTDIGHTGETTNADV